MKPILKLIVSIILLLCLADMPYGFYTLVRVVSAFAFAYLSHDYFKSKKEIWNQTHESLKIYGYPVEISVENEDEPGVSSGVYSLVKNKWITEPANFDDARLNEKYIKEFSAKIMTEIDNIEKKINKDLDIREKHVYELLTRHVRWVHVEGC